MEMDANIQALINISEKRLCTCADPTTIKYWEAVLEAIKESDLDRTNPQQCLVVKEWFHLDDQVNQFVPISLRLVLGIVAAYAKATPWSSCS